MHHAVPRSQGGADVQDNLIALCSRCHEDWHRRDVVYSDILTTSQIAYVVMRKGASWLHRNYPSRPWPF